MTVGTIEQTRTTGARPGTDVNAAGDAAGLFALLMATLATPGALNSGAGGQDSELGAFSDPSNTGTDSPIAAVPPQPTGNAPMPALPASAVPPPSAPAQGSAGPTPIDPDLLASMQSAAADPSTTGTPAATVPAGSAINAVNLVAIDDAEETHGSGPMIGTPAIATTQSLQGVPTSVATNAAAAATPGAGLQSASAAVSTRPIANVAQGKPSPERASALDASPADGTGDADALLAAQAVPAAAALDGAAFRPAEGVHDVTAATTAVTAARTRDAGPDNTDEVHATTTDAPARQPSHAASRVELPSVAPAPIESLASTNDGTERPKAATVGVDITAAVPAMAIPHDDLIDTKVSDDRVDAAGPRPIESAAAPQATTNTGAAQTRPEAPPAHAPVTERTALQHVSAHIARAVADGMDRLSLQLVPAELGRIDIALEVRDDGQVHATVRADNPTTLDLLQRDARNLERALESAGLRAEPGSLNFSLRNDGRQNQPFQPHQSAASGDGIAGEELTTAPAAAETRTIARGLVDLTI